VDFSFSEMQKLLRTEARNILEVQCPASLVRRMERDELGYDPALWGIMAESDWMALPFPVDYGGMDGGFLDLVVLVEEMGRANLSSPFIPTVVLGGLTILNSGDEPHKTELLPKIANGQMIATLAFLETDDSLDSFTSETHAVPENGGYRIKGTKLFVPYAHAADVIIVALGIECDDSEKRKPALFLVNRGENGLSFRLMENIAGQKLFEVDFDLLVSAESALAQGDSAVGFLTETTERATIIKCAEMVGAMGKVLEMTLDYAKERKQFGHPIGSFQTIQNYCANMAMDVEASKWNTYHAAWLLSEGIPSTKHVAVAKAWAGEACRRVLSLSHQIHGAIGFTKELDLELYIRRAKMAEIAFGNGDFHRKKIAQSIINLKR